MTPDTISAERVTDDQRHDDRADTGYKVPGLERGLKILAEFSPREPVRRSYPGA
jgi:hypothetical protein